MSDLPRIEPSLIKASRLRLSAGILSGVVAFFVTYWSVYALHTVFDIFFPQTAHVPLSWVLAFLFGFLTGIWTGYRVFHELSGYLKDT